MRAKHTLALGISLAVLAAGCTADPPDDLESLAVRAVGGYRTTVPVVSARFRYRPCPGIDPGRCGPVEVDPEAAAEFRARLREAAAGGEADSNAVVATAAWDLAVGELPDNVARAVEALGSMVERAPRNVAMLTAYSAASIVAARRLEEPERLFRAAEAALDALDVEPNEWAAEFNLAVALGEIGLTALARPHWHRAAAAAPDAAWRDEARRRAELVASASVAQDTGSIRDDVVGTLIGPWATAVLASDFQGARAELTPLLAHVDAEPAGAVVPDYGRELRKLRDATPAVAREHARAYEALARERERLRRFDLTRVQSGETAAQQLERLGSALLTDAWLTDARRAYQQADYETALELLIRVRDRDQVDVPSVQAARLAGLVHGVRGTYEASAQEYAWAHESAVQIGAWQEASAALFAIADLARATGNAAAMWRAIVALYQAPGQLAPDTQLQLDLMVGRVTRQSGMPRVAVAFAERARDAVSDPRHPGVAYAHLELAAANASVRREGVAREHLEAARRFAEAAPAELAAQILADATVAAADLGLLGSEGDALTRARDHYLQTGYGAALPKLFLASARRLRASAPEEAVRELDRAVDEIRRQLGGSPGAPQRAGLLDDARAATDVIVDLHVERGAVGAALEAVARYRRLLARAQYGGTTQRHEWAPATASPDRAVLVHWLNARRLHSWLVVAGGVAVHSVVEVPAVSGSGAGAASLFDVETMDRAQQRRLDALIFEPFRRQLEHVETVVIVPHDGTRGTPFGAALDADGRSAVARYRLLVTESGFIDPGAELAAVPDAAILSIGGTAVKPLWRLRLGDIPGAEAEARAVRLRYEDGRLLLGAAADPRSFLHALPEYGVVHIAAHALVEPSGSHAPQILLAPSEADADGAVTVADIESVELRLRPVIALSSCRGSRSLQGYGTSLAAAFFTAGARAVVASPVRVDDEVSRGLFERFHGFLRQELPVGEALRRAQLEFVHDEDLFRKALAFRVYVG